MPHSLDGVRIGIFIVVCSLSIYTMYYCCYYETQTIASAFEADTPTTISSREEVQTITLQRLFQFASFSTKTTATRCFHNNQQ